jgi:hypothetical protein
MTWTEEQIVALSPDDASTKAGRDLAKAAKWVTSGINELALWGECQGSGKTPYRTQIDLRNIAFKCSCPSRKFPCKHGLGLFLLHAAQPTLIQAAGMPDWVKEWIDKRNEKAQQKTEKVEDEPSVDAKKAEKQAKDKEKRNNERLLKVQAGANELELWLRDLVRAGLHSVPEKGHNFWEKTAARMVDAQAGGLGNLVREFGDIDYVLGSDWQEEVVHQTAKIYLLLEAFKNRDQLPAGLREDVRTLIGWGQSQKELLDNAEATSVKDVWLVLGRQTERQDDLTIQRNWLYGTKSEKHALILNFAFKNQPIPTVLIPGSTTETELVFYPSAYPLRAVQRGDGRTVPTHTVPALLANWEAAQEKYVAILSVYPWADQIPMLVGQLTLGRQGGTWLLQDQNGQYMEVHARVDEQKILQVLAYSGGVPLDMFVLRTKKAVLPVGIWLKGQYKIL